MNLKLFILICSISYLIPAVVVAQNSAMPAGSPGAPGPVISFNVSLTVDDSIAAFSKAGNQTKQMISTLNLNKEQQNEISKINIDYQLKLAQWMYFLKTNAKLAKDNENVLIKEDYYKKLNSVLSESQLQKLKSKAY